MDGESLLVVGGSLTLDFGTSASLLLLEGEDEIFDDLLFTDR